MQKCAPLPPKAKWGLGFRVMSNSKGRSKTALVEVGGAVEQARPLTFLDRHVSEVDVGQSGALEAVHRGGPADDLVDRRCGPLLLEQLPLVGVVEEGVHAVRHGIAGGLVARHGEQDDEEGELDVAKGLAFPADVGLDQPGDDVVGRAASAFLGHVVRVAHQLGIGHGRIGVEVRVVGVHDAVGPVEELLAVGFRDADEVGDRQQRQPRGDVVDEVAAILRGGLGHDVVRRHRELLLERGHRSRREQPRDDLAQPGVLGRIVIDQQCLRQVQLFTGDAVGQAHHRALAVRRPQVAVAGDGLDVLVTADHPVAAVVEDRLLLLVPPDRRGLAQLGELGDGNAAEQDVGIGEVIPRGQAEAGQAPCVVVTVTSSWCGVGHCADRPYTAAISVWPDRKV